MVGAWLLDALWFPLMFLGTPTLRAIGAVGFCASLVAWWVTLGIYRSGKATGKYVDLPSRCWKDQVW